MKPKNYKIKLSDLDYYKQMKGIPSFIRSFWSPNSIQRFQRGEAAFYKKKIQSNVHRKEAAQLKPTKQIAAEMRRKDDAAARKRDAEARRQKLANERALIALRKKMKERALFILRRKDTADLERE